MTTCTQPIPIADAIARFNDARERLRRALSHADTAATLGTAAKVRQRLELATELGREASTELAALLAGSPSAPPSAAPQPDTTVVPPDFVEVSPAVSSLVAQLVERSPANGFTAWNREDLTSIAVELVRVLLRAENPPSVAQMLLQAHRALSLAAYYVQNGSAT